jgi:primosomal protein N''
MPPQFLLILSTLIGKNMERIVLEVDERIASAWKKASPQKRKEINTKLNVRLGRELFDYSKEEFMLYLTELRTTMAARGLTQEKLDEIMNED